MATIIPYLRGFEVLHPENQVEVVKVPSALTNPVFRIVGGVDASKFTLDPVTGVLRFKVAPNYEAPDDYGKNHVYDLIVQARADGKVESNTIMVSIVDVAE